MAQPLRMYEPDQCYEITTRTIQGRFLLRPGKEENDIIAGVIGRAQDKYPAVRVHGLVVLSNHCTWIVSSCDPVQIPSFMGFVNGNLSRRLGQLHDWPGKMWERPQRPIAILDDESLQDRMKYLLAQGCKEDLVVSPLHWPGVTCIFSLLGRRPLVGHWHERDAETKARRRGESHPPDAFRTRYEIRFDKLPCWAHLSDEDYAACVQNLVDEIVREGRERRARTGKSIEGPRSICARDPHYRPETIAKSRAPLCHAATRAARRAFRGVYRAFVNAHKHAAQRLKEVPVPVTFPLWRTRPRTEIPNPPVTLKVFIGSGKG